MWNRGWKTLCVVFIPRLLKSTMICTRVRRKRCQRGWYWWENVDVAVRSLQLFDASGAPAS
jgi:hypothetical protein